jgi:hypothetical protein
VGLLLLRGHATPQFDATVDSKWEAKELLLLLLLLPPLRCWQAVH